MLHVQRGERLDWESEQRVKHNCEGLQQFEEELRYSWINSDWVLFT